jgi:hypothetical protein
VKITWNARSHDHSRVGTGAYIAKVTATSTAEDANGKAYGLAQAKTIRFGVVRK